MLKYFQDKYAMSEKGARDLLYAIIWTVIMDISFMAPVILGFKFIDEYIGEKLGENTISYYVIISVIIFAAMFIIAYFQYNSAFTKI